MLLFIFLLVGILFRCRDRMHVLPTSFRVSSSPKVSSFSLLLIFFYVFCWVNLVFFSVVIRHVYFYNFNEIRICVS
jgi:hypothetical protein